MICITPLLYLDYNKSMICGTSLPLPHWLLKPSCVRCVQSYACQFLLYVQSYCYCKMKIVIFIAHAQSVPCSDQWFCGHLLNTSDKCTLFSSYNSFDLLIYSYLINTSQDFSSMLFWSRKAFRIASFYTSKLGCLDDWPWYNGKIAPMKPGRLRFDSRKQPF